MVAVFDPFVASTDDVDGAVLFADPQPARPMPSARAALATTPALSENLIELSHRLELSATAYVGKHLAQPKLARGRSAGRAGRGTVDNVLLGSYDLTVIMHGSESFPVTVLIINAPP